MNSVHSADVNAVLAEIRQMRAQMQQNQPIVPEPRPEALPGGAVGVNAGVAGAKAPGFGELMQQAVGHVHDLQQDASRLRNAYVEGTADVSLAEVMIASQKSSVAFEAMSQVRNRLVRAYEDVMKMPV